MGQVTTPKDSIGEIDLKQMSIESCANIITVVKNRIAVLNEDIDGDKEVYREYGIPVYQKMAKEKEKIVLDLEQALVELNSCGCGL